VPLRPIVLGRSVLGGACSGGVCCGGCGGGGGLPPVDTVPGGLAAWLQRWRRGPLCRRRAGRYVAPCAAPGPSTAIGADGPWQRSGRPGTMPGQRRCDRSVRRHARPRVLSVQGRGPTAGMTPWPANTRMRGGGDRRLPMFCEARSAGLLRHFVRVNLRRHRGHMRLMFRASHWLPVGPENAAVPPLKLT